LKKTQGPFALEHSSPATRHIDSHFEHNHLDSENLTIFSSIKKYCKVIC